MSSRPVAASCEYVHEERKVVVMLDTAIEDDEPDEIKGEIKAARGGGDGGEWWISAALDPVEAEAFGKELARHASIAAALNESGVDGVFTWADDEDETADECAFVIGVDERGAYTLAARCACGKTHDGGLVDDYTADDPPRPFAAFAVVLADEGWICNDEGDGVWSLACRARCAEADA